MADSADVLNNPSDGGSDNLKIGFIGLGWAGNHQIGLLKKLGGVDVLAAADLSEKSLKSITTAHGVPRAFSDYKIMLRDCPELDAVSICTPNGLHAENAIAALEVGKHVLVEKPLAMNKHDAQKMVDAAQAAGRQLVTGFQYRFSPQSMMIHKQVQNGDFGKVMYVRAQALRRRGIPNWGVFGRKHLQGGGPLIDIGVHVMEMAHFMMGSPRPVAAFGNAWTFFGNKPSETISEWPNWDYKSYDVEDMAVGMIRFENGAMLSVEASFVAHIEKDVWNVNLLGEKGGANWESKQIFQDHGGVMMNMTPHFVGTWNNFEEKMRHFVEVCRGHRTNESPGEAGLAIQKMIDGIYQSAIENKEVAID